jgi:hypothetical protein
LRASSLHSFIDIPWGDSSKVPVVLEVNKAIMYWQIIINEGKMENLLIENAKKFEYGNF